MTRNGLIRHRCGGLPTSRLGLRSFRYWSHSRFAAAIEAKGGNPFFLHELLRTVRDDAIEPTADGAARVPELAPATVARSVLLRLGRLGSDAVALARAVAVLGPDAELRHAAKLAGLHGDVAQLALDKLITAEITRGGTPL